jgi:general transcription factor 3C polypeptide 5 (transcription factor C subunit 1)
MNEASAPVFALPPELASFVASVERALDVLGGLDKVSAAINAKDANASLVELNYSNRPLHDRNFTHPILGEAVETGNLMLKVVRRRRRHPAPGEEAGVYSVQVAGLVKQTIRFRGSCVC